MTYATMADRNAIENEKTWAERNLPVTTYGMLTETAGKFPDRNAVTYQLMSAPDAKAETLSWRELHAKSTQAANMLRDLAWAKPMLWPL